MAHFEKLPLFQQDLTAIDRHEPAIGVGKITETKEPRRGDKGHFRRHAVPDGWAGTDRAERERGGGGAGG